MEERARPLRLMCSKCAAPQGLSAEVTFIHSSPFWQISAKKQFSCSSRKHIIKYSRKQIYAALNDTSHESHASTLGNISSGPSIERELLSQSNGDRREDLSNPAVAGFKDTWYSVVERIGHRDEIERAVVESEEEAPHQQSSEAAVDLSKLHEIGQNMMLGSSYDTVIDIDMEEGGVLDDDEDNNDLHCGVELDALVESTILVDNLRNDFGIETATHVQLAAIPRVLDGRDIVIQSHTGTGKTLSFLLPILDEVDETSWAVQAILIAPTRELAIQISKECDRLVQGTEIRNLALIGGANPARQVEKFRKRQPHIVVGTPGRLAELYEQRLLRTNCVRWLVVDEIDQCLGDVFQKHVVSLMEAVGRSQKILVSATGDVDHVRRFAATHLDQPVLLRVGGAQRIPKRIEHYCCIVPARMKIAMVKKLMNTSPIPKRAIAFVDDPRRVDIVVDRLYKMKLLAGGLKGSAHKLERADVLNAFRKGRINLLVTTEVAARGLDIREITHVFNLDLPTDGDHYLHRAGRCGRAGEEGFVVSITSPDKAFVIGRLAAELGVEIPQMSPRHGTYSQPVLRTRKRRPSTGRRNGELFPKAADGVGRPSSTEERRQEFNPAKDVEKSLRDVSKAIETGDHDFTEISFTSPLKGRSDDESSSKKGSRNEKCETKATLKGKRNAKAKAKTRARHKARWRDVVKGRSASVGTEQRKPSTSPKDINCSQNSANIYSRDGRREYNRRRDDISYRAARDGWVGNRVAAREDERAAAED